MSQPPVLVCSRWWRARTSELSYAMRAIAAAASLGGPITVCVPGDHTEADGAFDLVPVGTGVAGEWPEHAVLPSVPAGAVVLTDASDITLGLPARVLSIAGTESLRVVAPEGERDELFVGLHVPVNPLAAVHRHNGFGFVGYILLLSGRVGTHQVPPDEVAWVTAGYPDADVVVIENGIASVWRGRALRGSTAVDTRTDLWRLIAHAQVCIDLAPGETLARECIESLRYGTPILVPAGATAAAVHAHAGGGLTYTSMGELVQCVGRMADGTTRQAMSDGGRRYADGTYGDPRAFTDRVAAVLASQ